VGTATASTIDARLNTNAKVGAGTGRSARFERMMRAFIVTPLA
jgi:hypothetical protein